MHRGGDEPVVEDIFFLRMGLKILTRPDGQHHGFFDIQSYMIPDGVNRINFSFKYSIVSFLPNVLDEKPREELPKFVENGIFKRMSV